MKLAAGILGLVVFAATARAQIASETNFNQKALVGVIGNNGSIIHSDGHIEVRGRSINLLVGDPARSTEDLPNTPQTLVDGRSPIVVTTRDLNGIHYQYTALETLVPEMDRVFVIQLKATNTTDKPGKARIAIELPPPRRDELRDSSKAIYASDSAGHRVQVENPWALMTPNSRPGEEGPVSIADALRKPRVAAGGVLEYAVRVRPAHQYSVAVGFYQRDRTWDEAVVGKQLLDVELEDKTVASEIDVLASPEISPKSGRHCLVIAGDAPEAKDDSFLHVTIRASKASKTKEVSAAAIWVFEDVPAGKIDCNALATGKDSVKPYALIRCGTERNRSLTSEQMVYEWTLAPGESQQGEFLRPYAPADAGALSDAAQRGGELLQSAEKWWQDWRSPGMELHLPDRDAEDLFYASLANLLLMRDRMGEYYIVTPGPQNYHAFWYRDGSFITRAFDVAGHAKESEESLRVFWQKPLPEAVNRRRSMMGQIQQSDDGQWAAPGDELDSQGQAIWGLFSHYQMTGDHDWLEKVYPSLLNGAKWMRKVRATTKVNGPDGKPVPYYGLFPKGFGEAISENLHGERFGKTYVLYHDFWGVLGARLCAEAADAMGKTDDAKWMRDEYEDFKKCVYDASKASYSELPDGGGYWKAAPDLDMGHDWWQVSAVFPCEALPPHDPMVNGVFKRFDDTKVQGIVYSWPYISTDWAQGQLIRGEFDDTESICLAYIRKATLHRTWTEDLNPDTRLGRGDQPHGWAAADYVLLLRNMLLAERDRKLFVCQAMPRDWLRDGKETDIKNAPTQFGNVDLHIRSHLAAGKIEFTLHRTQPRGQCTVRLGLRLPDEAVVRKVLVDGSEKPAAGGYVEFPLAENEVRVTVEADAPRN